MAQNMPCVGKGSAIIRVVCQHYAEIDGNQLKADVANVALDFDTTNKFSAHVTNAKVDADIDINQFVKSESQTSNEFADDIDDMQFDSDLSITDNPDDISNVNTSTLNTPTLVLAATVDKTNVKSISADISDADININHSIIKADVNAQTLGSNIHATANINNSNNRQVVNVDADNIDIEKVLQYIPEGTIPDGLTIHSGQVNNAKINLLRRKDNLSFSGSADLNDGSVTVEQTDIQSINASTKFTDAEIILNADLEANGQQARVNGSIRIDTDEPYFDLNAASDSFNPNAVMYLPAEGTAAFNAHLIGTVTNPIVEADIYSPYISYDNLSVSNVATHLKYQDDSVYLSDLSANVFGGTVTGDAELYAMDLSYNAHIKVNSIAPYQFANYLPILNDIDGLVFADVGINGVSDNLDKLKIYGSASAADVYYNNVTINHADTSFFVDGDDVKIDFLSAELPGLIRFRRHNH